MIENRSLIIACDVEVSHYKRLLKQTNLDGVGGYKIGFSLVFEKGMKRIVDITRRYTDKPIIYDHQKGGTDTPYTASLFMKRCKDAGIDAVILFPFTGETAEQTWIKAAQDADLDVMVGGDMTHPGFEKHHGGYIGTHEISSIYINAAKEGVRHFVVPAKLQSFQRADNAVRVYCSNPTYYSPGIGIQGGTVEEGLRICGPRWHPIIGTSIYNSKNMRKTTGDFIEELR